ncbi:MAG: hypothetical protein K0U98_02215 [Deltaproteobacteria bacterium]|nr:hypothetical protein [Deltaproteobacteria bacterium]
MKVLLVAPLLHDDALTRITLDWASQLRDGLYAIGQDVEAVIGIEAVRGRIEDLLISEKGNPGIFVFLDHGGSDALFGSDGKALIDARNLTLLHKKFVYALACKAAGHLGSLAVEYGAAGFLGFQDNFYIWKDSPAVFGLCLLSGLKVLIEEGKNSKDARARIVLETNAAVRRLKRHPQYDPGAHRVLIAALLHNRDSVVCLGGDGWRFGRSCESAGIGSKGGIRRVQPVTVS